MNADPLILSVAGSALGTLFAATLAYAFGIRRLRRERAFDRRLLWYEHAVTTLSRVGELAKIAANYQRDPEVIAERRALWQQVDEAFHDIHHLRAQAEMYASAPAYAAISEALDHYSETVNIAGRILGREDLTSPRPTDPIDAALSAATLAGNALLHAASRLATDAREHLDLDRIARPVRLYDREIDEMGKGRRLTLEDRVQLLGQAKSRRTIRPNNGLQGTDPRA